MNRPGRDEPIGPVIAIHAAIAKSADLVMTSVEEALAQGLEWSEDENGVFGQASATGDRSTIDVSFEGEGPCSVVRIVVGSSGMRPMDGHWRRTLDVTGMSPAIAALPRIERIAAIVTLCRRVLDEARSERGMPMEDVTLDDALQAGRRHAQRLAAEIGSEADRPIAHLAEARVRHPYAGAPGIVQASHANGWLMKARPCEVRLPSLASISFVGTDDEATLYVSGTLRTASVSTSMIDPMTTLRLLKELQEHRSACPADPEWSPTSI